MFIYDGCDTVTVVSFSVNAILELHYRAQKQALWDKAVKFLSANESRIRVETQKIHGEEFAVWRWLQVDWGLFVTLPSVTCVEVVLWCHHSSILSSIVHGSKK